MAENSSQENISLPLSQESCKQLLSLIGDPLSNFIDDDIPNNEAYNILVNDVNRIQSAAPVVNGYNNIYPVLSPCDVLQNENVLQRSEYKVFSEEFSRSDSINWGSVVIPCENNENIAQDNFIEQKRPVSSLLGSENWPGEFNFTISFNKQKATKGISWIYSTERNKLYIDKNVLCPVNFTANIPQREELYIRTLALYTSSEYAYEKVTRCVNHSMTDIKKNIFEAEHFVRCESKNASYVNDSVTERHSVIVPYENPPAGQEYSTYLYKFMCFSSCAGGPNRRGLMVVFTLENSNGEVLGRQKIELKVCACPVRDYNADEKKPEQRPVKKRKSEVTMPETPKKVKEELLEFVVRTADRNRIKFLKKMDQMYIMYSTAKNQPHFRDLITSSQSSSGADN